MYSDGTEVRMTGPDGNAIVEHDNHFLKDNAACSGRLFSRLVYENPAIDIDICLKFDESFDLCDAGGIAVKITCNDAYYTTGAGRFEQLFWIDKADIRAIFIFDQRRIFYKSTIKRWQLQMPAQSNTSNARKAETSSVKDIDTNSGCVTVFVRRGQLSNRTGFMPARQPNEPIWEQYQDMDTPKVIRESWFIPLEGEREEEAIFQFKNMNKMDIGFPDPEADAICSGSTVALKRSAPPMPTKRSKTSCLIVSSKTAKLGPSRSEKIPKQYTAFQTDDDEDDEDDEEVLPPSHLFDIQGAIMKQEDDILTTSAARDTTPIHHQPPQPAISLRYRYGRSKNTREMTVASASTKEDSEQPQFLSIPEVHADDEVLRLRLEGNLIRQQMRRNELRRTLKH